MGIRAVSRHRLVLIALAVTFSAVACGQQESPAVSTPPSVTAQAGQTSTSVVPAPMVISPVFVYHLHGEAHDVRLSSAVLWVSEFNGTEVVLNGFSTAGKLISHILLGSSNSSGVNSHLQVAADGSIWVSDDDTLYRFSPGTRTVDSIQLAVKDRYASPGALSETTALPGTWISAFTFNAAGNVVVARNNVPVLEVLTASGQVSQTVTIGGNITSVSDMDLRADGLHLLVGRPTRVAEAVTPLVEPLELTAALSAPPAPLRSSFLGLTDVFLPNGDSIQTSSSGEATMTRADGSAAIIKLAQKNVTINNPAGNPVDVTVRKQLYGAGLGPDNTVWALLAAFGGGTDLVQLR